MLSVGTLVFIGVKDHSTRALWLKMYSSKGLLVFLAVLLNHQDSESHNVERNWIRKAGSLQHGNVSFIFLVTEL